MNMGVPEEVIFEEGKITNLYNIPEGIETIESKQKYFKHVG